MREQENNKQDRTTIGLDLAIGGTGFVCRMRVGKWWKKEVWPTPGWLK